MDRAIGPQSHQVLVWLAVQLGEVATDVHVVANSLDIEHRAVRRCVPRSVCLASGRIELDEIRRGHPTNRVESSADVDRSVLANVDGLHSSRGIRVEVGVERTGDGIELGDSVPGRPVDTGEDPADVEILLIGRQRDRENLSVSSGDDRAKHRVELSCRYLDRSEVWPADTANLGELAGNVIAAIRFEQCPHRRWVGCVLVLTWVHCDRAEKRGRRVVRVSRVS